MKFLLMRSKYTGKFSRFEPVRTEPLELEYLAEVINQEGHEYEIYDTIVRDISPEQALEEYNPDVVCLTGYINATDTMLGYAKAAKKHNQNIKVILGGVHAEVNYSEFYSDDVDIIVHSGGYQTFWKLLHNKLDPGMCLDLKGICIKDSDNRWKFNQRAEFDHNSLIHPDRSHFYKYRDYFNYMYYGPCAMVKSAFGCPYKCNFCYCKYLNDGKYTCRKISDVVDEIEKIDNDLIWFNDDTFLVDRKRITEFCRLIKTRNINKKFICYSRADFVAKNEDIMIMLKDAGLIDVIVGLEAIDDSVLSGYDKLVSAKENEECIRILKKHDIHLTALFISGTHFTKNDFRRLRDYIKRMEIKLFTVSIFTPVPGTKEFNDYRYRLITQDRAKWDFISHVVRPANLSRWTFTKEINKLYLRHLLVNSGVRFLLFQFIKDKFFNITKLKKAGYKFNFDDKNFREYNAIVNKSKKEKKVA